MVLEWDAQQAHIGVMIRCPQTAIWYLTITDCIAFMGLSSIGAEYHLIS